VDRNLENAHQSHTTVPGPITVTTENGARLTIANRERCTVSIVNHSVGSDGIRHEEVSEGKFIVLKHGLNYIDHQPSSVWLELCPVVSPGDPSIAHGRWLDGHTSPDLKDRTPAPDGWVNKPGSVDVEKDEAATAMEIARLVANIQSFGSIVLTTSQRDLLDKLRG
jgi:hypothetical protein